MIFFNIGISEQWKTEIVTNPAKSLLLNVRYGSCKDLQWFPNAPNINISLCKYQLYKLSVRNNKRSLENNNILHSTFWNAQFFHMFLVPCLLKRRFRPIKKFQNCMLSTLMSHDVAYILPSRQGIHLEWVSIQYFFPFTWHFCLLKHVQF